MNLAEANILHIITQSGWGGAPRVVKLLATETEANASVACGTGGKLIPKLQNEGISVYGQPALQSPPDPVTDARAFAHLYRLLQRESVDLVHCHSTKAGLLGRLAAWFAGIPTVFTVHGWGFYNTDYRRVAPAITHGERVIARITDTIVCVSKNDCKEGRKHGIIQHADNTVIHNGVAPISPPSDRQNLYEEAGIEPGTVVIGAIARLVPQKNPFTIIRAGGELKQRGHDVAIIIIGDGPLLGECEKYADEHGIEVHLLGFRERAHELLMDFDVFLMPSLFEGFPFTVLESLHAGVPVVAYDVGGIAEVIHDGETGFVAASGDVPTFVDRAEQLVTNPKWREEIGARAKTLIQNHYTAKQMIENYERVYAGVLDIV